MKQFSPKLDVGSILGGLIVLALVIYPIIKNEYALWDGAILAHSIETNDYEVIKTWFLESGAPIILALHTLVFKVYQLSGLSVDFIYSLLTSVMVLATYIIMIGIFRQFGQGKQYSEVAIAVLFSVLPFWSTYLSYIMANYAFCVLFIIASIYALWIGKYIWSCVLFMLASDFQVGLIMHLFMFVICYALHYRLYNELKITIKKITQYYLFLIAFLLLRSLIFESYGHYSDYNEINVDNFLGFFLSLGMVIKLALFLPILLGFMLSKHRWYYFFLSIMIVGLIGVFFLAGKVNYVGFPSYPWFSRFDIPFYFCLLLMLGIFLYSENSPLKRMSTFLLFVITIYPHKLAVDYPIAKEVTDLQRFYERAPNISEAGYYSVRLFGIPYVQANYHLFKHYGNKGMISFDSLQYFNDQCAQGTLYSRMYICDGFDINAKRFELLIDTRGDYSPEDLYW